MPLYKVELIRRAIIMVEADSSEDADSFALHTDIDDYDWDGSEVESVFKVDSIENLPRGWADSYPYGTRDPLKTCRGIFVEYQENQVIPEPHERDAHLPVLPLGDTHA